jgi:hypothetical protein
MEKQKINKNRLSHFSKRANGGGGGEKKRIRLLSPDSQVTHHRGLDYRELLRSEA